MWTATGVSCWSWEERTTPAQVPRRSGILHRRSERTFQAQAYLLKSQNSIPKTVMVDGAVSQWGRLLPHNENKWPAPEPRAAAASARYTVVRVRSSSVA